MAPEEIEELEGRLRQAHEHSRELHRMVPPTFRQSVRETLARCAISILLEHHSGVIALIKTAHYASAAAMLRPVLEAGTIAYWLLYAAPTERVQAMALAPLEGADQNSDTPTLGRMINALADSLPSLPSVRDLADGLGKPNGRWLNKYTHGGIPQLKRKGPDEPPFGFSDMIRALIRADLFALVGSAAATVVYELPELETYVAVKHRQLFDEYVWRFDLDAPYEEWQPLPKTIVIDDWDLPS
ncbi:DUF6988 family protein [Luteimonas panaciterrae]|uniref:DUF6988 family protein n=1 Tax=Luteimonas panaciterrae TaxID=363885 RepID=UPI001CFBE7AE|nr:hypothetical protein [Luteimonas panaciterrae]